MPATFGDVYERLSERYPDPRERGREFEPLVANVLRTDRMFSGRFKNVWQWSDWPDRRSRDIGVDHRRRASRRRPVGGPVQVLRPAKPRCMKRNLSTFPCEHKRSNSSERLIVSTTSNWSWKPARRSSQISSLRCSVSTCSGLKQTTDRLGCLSWKTRPPRSSCGPARRCVRTSRPRSTTCSRA